MLTFFVKLIRAMLIIVMAISSGFISPVTGAKEGNIKHQKEGCNASIAVISDMHMKDNFIRQGMLELGYADMASAEDKLDAVAFCGDITDHGYIDMWECFAEATAKYDLAEQLILVEGNHDTWGPDRDDLSTVKQTFIDYNKKVAGRDVTEMYYSTTVNGYPVIVLGSEGDHTSATVSQAQIDWFAGEMEKASETGLPIFIFCHQPFNKTHGLPKTWEMEKNPDWDDGGIGEASDTIKNIMKQYNNVFYISGHIHAGFETEASDLYSSVEKHNGYTLINVPCYMYPDVIRGGHITNGTGYVIEIYDGEVLLRARNFAASTWCTQYDVSVPLT